MTMKTASALFPAALLTAAGEAQSIVLDSSLFDWTSTLRAFFRIVPAE